MHPLTESHHTLLDGTQSFYTFANGYGASVIRNSHTMGGTKGRFELAILDQDGHLLTAAFDGDDILEDLTHSEVQDALTQIQNLPPLNKTIIATEGAADETSQKEA